MSAPVRPVPSPRAALLLLAALALAVPALARGGLDERAIADWRRAIANDDIATLARLLDTEADRDVSGATAAGRSPVDGASLDTPDETVVAALVGTRTGNGKSALMVASKIGDLALVRALVAAGADPGETSATGGTPFMFAVLGDRLDVARWLRARGAALDARGSNGWSATTIAAAKGLDAMLDWLLAVGAPADEADVYGFTPLMRAVDNAHERAARRLLAAGARVNAADERGNTALHHAVAGGRAALVTLLLDAGADPALANREGLTPAALAGAVPTGSDGAGAVAATTAETPLPAALRARLRAAAGER